jgi:hypothetical protein
MKNNIAGEFFTVSNFEYLEAVLDLFSLDADIKVEGCVNHPDIMLTGKLPRGLWRGLRRAVGFGVALPCRSRREPVGWLVWRSGCVTFNVKSLVVLADLLAEVAVLKGQK